MGVTLTSAHREPLRSSQEVMKPRVQHPAPKKCTDTTEYSSHLELLWRDVGHRCIRDVVADECPLYGLLCHAWEAGWWWKARPVKYTDVLVQTLTLCYRRVISVSFRTTVITFTTPVRKSAAWSPLWGGCQLAVSCRRFQKSIWFLSASSPSAKKQTDVIAISLGERHADVSTRLDFYSPSEVWTNGRCAGACVAARRSRATVARHCPRTPNRPWLQSSLQERVRPPPIWKINNAGENLSAVSSLTASTQPCPSWISASCFYTLALSAVFNHALEVLSHVLVLNSLVIVLSHTTSFLNRVTGVKDRSLYRAEPSIGIDWSEEYYSFTMTSWHIYTLFVAAFFARRSF